MTKPAEGSGQPKTQDTTPAVEPLAPSRTAAGITFDPASVRRSGAILMCLVAALLLGLWLFSVTRHFLFSSCSPGCSPWRWSPESVP